MSRQGFYEVIARVEQDVVIGLRDCPSADEAEKAPWKYAVTTRSLPGSRETLYIKSIKEWPVDD